MGIECCGVLSQHEHSEVNYHQSKYVCVLTHFSHVRLFAVLWIVACQAPLSTGFSRQEYWMGGHAPLQGIFPTQGLNPCLLCLLNWQAGCLPLVPPGKRNLSMTAFKETSTSLYCYKKLNRNVAIFFCLIFLSLYLTWNINAGWLYNWNIINIHYISGEFMLLLYTEKPSYHKWMCGDICFFLFKQSISASGHCCEKNRLLKINEILFFSTHTCVHTQFAYIFDDFRTDRQKPKSAGSKMCYYILNRLPLFILRPFCAVTEFVYCTSLVAE